MSSTKNTHPNLELPAGPIHPSKKDSGKHPIAAVIRPAPAGSGLKGTIRFDEAEAVPGTEPNRSDQLEDYVSWLQTKSRLGKSATEEAIEAQSDPTPVTTQGVFQTIKPLELSSTQSLDPIARGKSDAHDVPSASPITQNPTTAPTFEPTVQEVTLSEAEIAKQVSKALARADAVAQEQADGRAAETGQPPAIRVDGPESALDSMVPALPQEQKAASPLVEPNTIGQSSALPTQVPRQNRLSEEETQQFISTISKAIASVLTERPEKQIENQVRRHFETDSIDLGLNPVQSNPVRTNVDLNPPTVSQVAAESSLIQEQFVEEEVVAQIKTRQIKSSTPSIERPAPVPDTTPSQSTKIPISKEVPTHVAAWDVDEFRWPTVTNQMIVTGNQAMSQLYESLSMIVTTYQQRLAITSLKRNAGTTSITISLARWAAACGNSVLIVDADISNPELSRRVGLAPNVSWLNACNQALPVAEVVIRSRKSNICIMPLSAVSNRASWPRFIYDGLADLLDQIRDHFDLVLIDAGPATQLMDELSRSNLLVDAAMLVHDNSESQKFRKTKNLLHTFGLEKVMVTQNRIKQDPANVA